MFAGRVILTLGPVAWAGNLNARRGAADMPDEKRKFAATVRVALGVAALLVIVWALYACFLAYE